MKRARSPLSMRAPGSGVGVKVAVGARVGRSGSPGTTSPGAGVAGLPGVLVGSDGSKIRSVLQANTARPRRSKGRVLFAIIKEHYNAG